MKIIKIVSRTQDFMFEGVIQNDRYKVVRANNILFEFTIDDFPLINLNDLITFMKITGDFNNDQVQDRASYIIGYSHIKSIIDYYYAHLALTNFEYVTSFKKKPKVPK